MLPEKYSGKGDTESMIKCLPLFSGSAGNSTYVNCSGEEFLIDCGVSCKAVSCALEQIGSSISNIRGIFVTHEHIDHIKGLEIISKKYGIPVYMNTNSAKYIYCSDGYENLRSVINILDPTQELKTENAKFDVYKTPHDSWGSVCYRVTTDDDTLGYATDIGYVTKGIASALMGCRTVVIESNHDIEMLKNGPYPVYLQNRILSRNGHLSNDDCARFLPYLAQSGTQKIWLAHLSKENNLPPIALECAENALCDYQNVELEVCKEKQ